MTTEVSETLDPRIRRTRLLLQQALDKLLKKQEFDSISVRDITTMAALNRATFYDHYTDKFELLECMVGSRFHDLLAERKVQFDVTCASALKVIVLAVCDYLARLQGPHGKRQLEPHMESAIVAVVRGTLLEGLKPHPAEKPITPELVAALASWAIYGAAREWARTPDRCAPDEIADAVTILVSPILRLPCQDPAPSTH